ncbi:MAG TPA: flagellar hook-length control protein FliK, partial [Thauera aminoaromatica]|nr:flagellar hook-length control protein FliK [Thauera aminoaromatica]
RSASTTARAALDETAAPRPGAIPERLMPVVHQQLDALATQQYVWQGQAWPGQNFEWWIEDPQHEGEHAGDEPENTWNTTLRLTLPRLGGVEARLHLTPAGVALRLVADDRATLQTLDGGAAALASALEAANLKLTGLVIEPRAVAPNREVASDA